MKASLCSFLLLLVPPALPSLLQSLPVAPLLPSPPSSPRVLPTPPSSPRGVLCPSVRFGRSGCERRYECSDKCEERVKCSTSYQYKCTDFRRQECKNVWQNQCNGRGRRKRRSPLSRAPPYWLDPSNTLTVDDPPPQEDPSDLPLLSPGVGGQVFQFSSPPKSRSCWMQVRRCSYRTYKTLCENVPTQTCEDRPTTTCKQVCGYVYYCNRCPGPPVVGPPTPPPPGTFIISAPAPPTGLSPPSPPRGVLDARKRVTSSEKGETLPLGPPNVP